MASIIRFGVYRVFLKNTGPSWGSVLFSKIRVFLPAHPGKLGNVVTGSSSLFPTFQCFKCQAKGNQLDLWAAAMKKPLYDATVDLCQRLGRDIPWLTSRTEKMQRSKSRGVGRD